MCRISISQSPIQRNQIKVRDESWRRNLKSNYTTREVSFGNLFRIVQSDYRTYSAGEFKDHYAKNDNWITQELLILDIDDGLPLEDAKKMFSEYKAMIHTSTSHQKNKGGIKCDRYRVIIALKERLHCSVKEYTDTMKYISKKVFPFIDDKCVDPARIYFGYSDCEIHYTGGSNTFDFMKYKSIAEKIAEINKDIEKPKETNKYKTTAENPIDEFNKNNTVDGLLSRYGYIQQGDRWLSPNSSTGVAGVILQDCDDGLTRAYNHHSSDSWENETAFGIYAAIEHGGDISSACRALKVSA